MFWFRLISALIQEEESSLQKLNLSDCKLKTDINNVINALGSNQCLQVMNLMMTLMKMVVTMMMTMDGSEYRHMIFFLTQLQKWNP